MKKSTQFLPSSYQNPTWVAIGALFLSLLIAFGADRLSSLLVDVRQSDFLPLVGYLLAYSMPFILGAMLLVLAWAFLIKYPSSRTVAIIYIVIGSLFIGTYLTAFTGFPVGLRNTFIGYFRFAIVDLGKNSSLYYLAAFWIIVGIACLMRRSLKTESTIDEKQGKSTD
jgi:hypothetical protein